MPRTRIQVGLTLSQTLIAKIDGGRGLVSRSAYVEAILGAALRQIEARERGGA